MNKKSFSTNPFLQNLTQFTYPKGTVNIRFLLSPPNSSFSIRFFPGNVRLETSQARLLDARGGFGLLLYFFLVITVTLTPVRYYGGQVYKIKQLV
jgi:hypothetical protein